MNKNRKIVALICALAMIISVFAGFTVVSAADEAGMTLEVTDVTATSATVVAKYVGLADGIAGATVNFTVPSGTQVKSATAGIPGASVTANDTVDGQVTSAVTGLTGNTQATDGETVATFAIEWATALEEDFTVELLDSASMTTMDPTTYDFTEYLVGDNTLAKATATISKYVDPNATVAPTPVAPIATRAPRPTETPVDPDATVAPTKAPVEVTVGMTLEVTDVTDTNATVIAKYVGFADGIAGATVNFTVPSGTEVASATAGIPGASVTANDTVDGQITSAVTGLTGNTAATDGATVATFVLNLAAPVEEDFIVELLGSASMTTMDPTTYEFTEYLVSDGTLPAAWTVIPGATDPDPEPEPPVSTPEPASKPVVLPDLDITADDIPANTDELYVAVVVKDKDGNVAEYGTDYEAEITLPDGTVKKLTEDELSNILNGYFDLVDGAEDLTWADVIDGLKFKAYADGLTFAAQLINGSEVITGDEIEVTLTPEKAPTLSVSPKTKSVKVGDKVTITPTVKNGDLANVTATVTTGADLAIFQLDDATKKATLTAASVGKVVVTYVYDDGKTVLDETATITITKATTPSTPVGGGSSSSGGSSGGSIAHGSVGTTGSTTPSRVAFVDIDTVPWAEDAILALADMGVVNGRDGSIFDPNGTVTRAEFAKMVVLAFKLTGTGSIEQFSDVSATDWFAPYVACGYVNGVISGYDDGTFRPNGLISRQEMAAMISRAINAVNKTLPEIVAPVDFADADQIGDWAMEAVTTLQKGGVINGMTETTFAPLENATRAQAAVIIYRAITNAK